MVGSGRCPSGTSWLHSPPPPPVSLGPLPAVSAIASLPTIGQGGPRVSEMAGVSHSLAMLPALSPFVAGPPPAGGCINSNAGACKQSGAMVLSTALPPITAKLEAKIAAGQFVAMKELLADNMALCSQLEAFPAHQHFLPATAKPRLQEIDSPLTWVSCFLTYAAVRTGDVQTRNLLTYGRLVVREAQRHSGTGWLEYDRIFRQHAALSPSTVWNELNPSLHASTILSYRAGPGQVCSICHEPDHSTVACAMQALQPHCGPTVMQTPAPRPLLGLSSASAAGPMRRPVRQETLERICVSWNRGHCTFPACKFRHVCAACKQRGHRAKDCQVDSSYRIPQGGSPRASSSGSSSQA